MDAAPDETSAAEQAGTVERYARFARDEAPGRSALYEDWAAGVAGDALIAGILARIPATRRQPPLVFAVTRMLGAPERPFPDWAAWVREHADDVVAAASIRRLQTNEPQRCAALLPAFAGIDGPIALLEVGASAGLCLYPDRYSYRYRGPDGTLGPDGAGALDPHDGVSPVVLDCAVEGVPPLSLPRVVWRAGIDLQPLNAADPDDRRFLTSLVWPGEAGRADRIRAALDIVAAEPPLLVEGDATDPAALRSLAGRAPRDATLVVTTPGVLPHIDRPGRERLLAAIDALDAVWITIDPPGLHDWRLKNAWGPLDPATWDGFVLARDGEPLAAVDPLGGFVRRRASDAGSVDAAS
ncbi:DUF2332 domain-containing protein [Microbacterium sp. NEAU-LLC]|uniref:DUF2332 domain-containing protein n=1 Tax=Microbacterium helvum TaxID=2773713 RepID=A0ABR8NQ54_9MICO|nr:DUF2332 domain-containing protein [Microbacterium helvum]MBD3942775.1 DUF2332 domain-containing protein [Microbacterium helvum]